MKTTMIGTVLALGVALFACAAPTEQELPTEAPAEAPAQGAAENTGETSEELRVGGFGGQCGSTCQSDTGDQSCCCAVGDRCVKGVTFCKCEKASVIGGGFGSSGGVILR